MSNVIQFPSTKDRKKISEKLSSANAEANSTRSSKVTVPAANTFDARMLRIRKSLEEINQLLAELKAKSREQLDK